MIGIKTRPRYMHARLINQRLAQKVASPNNGIALKMRAFSEDNRLYKTFSGPSVP